MSIANLKRYLNEDELDLSLQDLETVPVKRILDLRKVSSLDLSCNLLAELPEDFGTLVLLKKLDLSKNRLTTLPSSFGDLTSLQQLDLRDNRITMLPPCISRLRRLRWLDLKGNPLAPDLREAAGDCVNQADCVACAQRVVPFMRQVAARLEKERQRRLERERQAAEAERQRELAEKRLAKEERRRAYQRRLQEAAESQAAEADDEEEESAGAAAAEDLSPTPDGDSAGTSHAAPKQRGGRAWLLLAAALAVLAVLLGAAWLHRDRWRG